MSEYTPGPWHIEPDIHGCKNIRAGGEDFFTCNEEIGYTHGLVDESEDTGNARLIAAAPDQNEALKGILLYVDDLGSWSQVVIDDAAENIKRIAKTAIAKAVED